ncbi:MAG: hypothetical protein ACE5DR_07760 [Thermodesulfobacteriota bacterium]
MITNQTPMEYFKGLVTGAMKNQRVETLEEVEFYLTSMLGCFIEASRLKEDILAMKYLTALRDGGISSEALLREVGDISLFISGFFPESLTRKIAGLQYYRSMGALSYGRLAAIYSNKKTTARFGGIFDELSGRFSCFADVLSEVSERTSLGSSRDILCLYERWLSTKSETTLILLRELGIEPCDTDMRITQ